MRFGPFWRYLRLPHNSLDIYASFHLDSRHTTLEKLLRHISERHPFDALMLVYVLDDPIILPSAFNVLEENQDAANAYRSCIKITCGLPLTCGCIDIGKMKLSYSL